MSSATGLVLREAGCFLGNKVRKQGENPKLLQM